MSISNLLKLIVISNQKDHNLNSQVVKVFSLVCIMFQHRLSHTSVKYIFSDFMELKSWLFFGSY